MNKIKYKPQDYFITNHDNEFEQVMSIIKKSVERARKDDGNPMWKSYLERLYFSLEESQGKGIEPWQYNRIIQLLLTYVPEEDKKDY